MFKPVNQFSCQACGAQALRQLEEYSELPRVTSDCKPWPVGGSMTVCGGCGMIQKLPNQKWLDEIGRIYGAYKIYDLSQGAEQVIFDGSGQSAPRSKTLIDFIMRQTQLGKTGKLIDIGCGNGAALANFSGALPDWQLYGTELSDTALPLLRKLPNFKTLYTCEPKQIDERFDVVTMIHALEHMPAPAQTLHEAAQLLAPGGKLFVEVPDIETSPFDLIVADHLSHFTRASLGLVARRMGLNVTILRNDVLKKEVTLLAEQGVASQGVGDPVVGRSLLEHNVRWLQALIVSAKEAAMSSKKFGIFGTSISGSWLYGALKDKVAFFVDEDASRIGRQVDGRPIVAPADVPDGGAVFVPLIPSVAASLLSRMQGLKAQFVAPPELS